MAQLRLPVRLLVFACAFFALQSVLRQFWASGASTLLIDDATVWPAAWLANLIGGTGTATAQGDILAGTGVRLHVLYGCEGSDVWLLLTAAMLIAPISVPRKLLGWLAGTLLVFLLNQARVLVLYFALRAHPDWFGPLHGTAMPLIMVCAVVLFFLLWSGGVRTPRHGLDAAGHA